jgi:tetratricopeptide (TPR) repeat protein
MAGRLVDDDPETAYRHAQAARRLASRVGIVREAAGLAAYHAGEWSEALAELRAARRLRNTEEAYLPILADCERGLGRPERALDLAKSPAVRRLEQADRIELKIVESGARRDLGQRDAAVVTLQVPELRDKRLRPWSARLFYAYADALLEAGREDEASEWFARAAAADRDGETDAAERYAELEGLEILDVEDVQEPATDTTEPHLDASAEGPLADTEQAAVRPDEVDTSTETGAEDPAEAEDPTDEPSASDSPDTDETDPADVPEAADDSEGGVAAETPETDDVPEAQDGADAADTDTAEAISVPGEPGPVDGPGDEPSERAVPPAGESRETGDETDPSGN